MLKTRGFIKAMLLFLLLAFVSGCSSGNTAENEAKATKERNEVKEAYEKRDMLGFLNTYSKADDAKKDEYRAAYRELLREEAKKALEDDKKGDFSEESLAKRWNKIKNLAWLAEENPGGNFELEKLAAVEIRKFDAVRNNYEQQYCSVVRNKDSGLADAIYVSKYLLRQLNNKKGVFYACDYSYSSFMEEHIPKTDRGECTLDFNASGITNIRPGAADFWAIETGTITLTDVRGFSYEVPNYKVLSPEKAEIAKKLMNAGNVGDKLKEVVLRQAQNVESELSRLTTAEVKVKVPEKAKDGDGSIEKKAQDDLTKRGFTTNIVATTFGMSQDGYLAVDNSNGTQIYVVDIKNNQVATASSRTRLSNYNVGLIANSGHAIVDFILFNDPAGKDDEYGEREGNNHIMPVYCSYKIENGEIVPGKLTSGKGKKPKKLQGFLYEAKHVDLINMYLTQSMSLLSEAKKKGLSL